MHKKMLVTIDTEALPARASDNHEDKLIWGRFQNGRAGIIEICDVIESFGGKGLFFLEVAASFSNLAVYREVNSYLERRGHMVEWHYHPEILGKEFWREQGASGVVLRQDLYDLHDAWIILSAGLDQFVRITGRKPHAYRAGSFRWNQHTIEFLEKHGIPYSFNACRETALKENYETFDPKEPRPFDWSSSVREVPCGEVSIDSELVHLRFPRRFPSGWSAAGVAERIAEKSGGLVNMLLHSWSFLERDGSTGYYFYKDRTRMDNFCRILEQCTERMELISKWGEW